MNFSSALKLGPLFMESAQFFHQQMDTLSMVYKKHRGIKASPFLVCVSYSDLSNSM